MNNLFNISGWTGGMSLSEDDIVYMDITGKRYYYYSLIDNNTANPTGTSTYFSRFFHWQPSYASSANLEDVVTPIQFGDGYRQQTTNSLDSNKLVFNLNYRGISLKKARAISHFLQNNSASPFVFNPNGIFKQGNGFICDTPQLTSNSYDNYDMYFQLTKVYEIGNFVDTLEINAYTTGASYFMSGIYIEKGIYKIKYKEGAINFATDETPNWWMPWDASTTPDYYIHYGSTMIEFSGIGGNGTGVSGSWPTEIQARQYMRIQSPEKNINHTGGFIGMSQNSVLNNNQQGTISLKFNLYKIADL